MPAARHELGDAAHTYSLLTIGDGLVSQIPALIISTAAGIIVTRVGDDSERRNLGTQITEQVAGNPRSLMLAAGALILLSVVPGFPTHRLPDAGGGGGRPGLLAVAAPTECRGAGIGVRAGIVHRTIRGGRGGAR